MSQIPVQLIESELGGLLIAFQAAIETQDSQFILDTALLETEIASNFPYTTIPKRMLDLEIGGESFQIQKNVSQTETHRLGLDFLSSRIVALDLLGGSVNFRSYPQALKSGRVINFEWLGSGKPLARIKINGDSYRALFDTGVPFSIVDTDFVNAHADAFEKIEIPESVASRERREHSPLPNFQRVKSLELAGKRIAGTAVAIDFASFFPQGPEKFSFVLGANFLADDLWILDFRK